MAKSDQGYQLVRLAIAAILLTAAALKGYDLATGPVAGNGLLDSRWVLVGVVEMELFLSFWLVGNIWPQATWAAVLSCFTLFAGVTFYKALAGYASCGCFGRVPVNPWYTATLDSAIILSLLRWRPARGESWSFLGRLIHWGQSRFRNNPYPPPVEAVGTVPASNPIGMYAISVLVAWLAVGLPTAYVMTNYTPTTLSNAGQIVGQNKIVVLEPETWIGKRFPFLDYIDIGDKIKTGNWLILFFHHDCPKCLEAIPKYEEQARESVNDPTVPHVAMIEMPPYGSPNTLPIHRNTSCVIGRLSDQKEWFAETPLTLMLSSGMVTPVRETQRILTAATTANMALVATSIFSKVKTGERR